MKDILVKSTLTIGLILMVLGLLGCKGLENESESSKVSIDISGLLANMPVASSSSDEPSSEQPEGVSSPTENEAQSAVKTLMVVPLTYSKHGEPYTNETFDDDTEEDFEDDAMNSVNFLQFIQLPTSSSTVELEVPTASDGWQLLAAATKGTVTSAEEIEDSVIVYLGFTNQDFQSADDFNDANVSLEITRYCDQDEEDRPKGCATFDGEKEAIVTSAVEIHQIKINDVDQGNGGNAFPWIVRSSPGTGQITASTAASRLDSIVSAYGSSISKIAVHVTHQLSDGKSPACKALDYNSSVASFRTECGEQVNTRNY